MTEQFTRFGVVLVTTASEAEAKTLARNLLEAKLTACVNWVPVNSIYAWQGEIITDTEWQLAIKTDLSVFPLLEAKIKELHSYETPKIIALPIITGSKSYLNWIEEHIESDRAVG